jgi:hypothetical protein
MTYSKKRQKQKGRLGNDLRFNPENFKQRISASPLFELIRTARIIMSGYTNNRTVLEAYNYLAPLFRNKLDILIDAKFLAAIKEVQSNSPGIKRVELYYSWILFHEQVHPPPTPLITLTNFREFQKSWLVITDNYKSFINPGYLDREQIETKSIHEDDNQLKFDFK